MESRQQHQLQGNQPKQNEESLTLISCINRKIESQFIGQPKAGGQLTGVQQQEHRKTSMRGEVQVERFQRNRHSKNSDILQDFYRWPARSDSNFKWPFL